MRLYYFVHITGTEQGISGIPRVVKCLGRGLTKCTDVELVPVRWCHKQRALVHAESDLLKNLARFSGPELPESEDAGDPIKTREDEWILFAEVPHLQSHDCKYPSVSIGEPISCARRLGLRTAVVLHDVLPLTHAQAFVVLPKARDSGALPAAEDIGSEANRLKFALYAQALVNTDLLLPVSRTSGKLLSEWLVANGNLPQQLPLLAPVPLAEEVSGQERKVPLHPLTAPTTEPVEFVAVGTVCARKNQLTAMTAFNRALARRPDLDLRLHIVGLVDQECSVLASLLARQSEGKIILHGRLPDNELARLTERARASVFISLAEGFGLPVAESLWQGKPCICSNLGSIAEVAASGGCMLVDPTNVDEVASAFEAVAEDDALYTQLLNEIAARPMRTWADYAQDIVSKLIAISVSEDQDAPELAASLNVMQTTACFPKLKRRSSLNGTLVRPRFFIIPASDLTVSPKYVENLTTPVRVNSTIRYSKAIHGQVESDLLFFGPRIALRPGLYDLRFDGTLDGELELHVAADGEVLLATGSLKTFKEPFSFVAPAAVRSFEVVGLRSESLNFMTLRSILLERRRGSEFNCADSEESPTETIVLSRQGNPLGRHFVLATEDMEVNQDYGSGLDNALRSKTLIHFDSHLQGKVSSPGLFHGPYLVLPPGCYKITLRGALKGTLKVKFAAQSGNQELLNLTLDRFGDPITVNLYERVKRFEIIGSRTPDTRAMSLSGIEFLRVGPPVEDPAFADDAVSDIRN
jgi:glycosyltransferase involved in cell wall biosynthesis